MKLKDKYKLKQSVYSPTGLVKKDTIVKIEEMSKLKVRVSDNVGRIFWVQPDILIPLSDIYTKGE